MGPTVSNLAAPTTTLVCVVISGLHHGSLSTALPAPSLKSILNRTNRARSCITWPLVPLQPPLPDVLSYSLCSSHIGSLLCLNTSAVSTSRPFATVFPFSCSDLSLGICKTCPLTYSCLDRDNPVKKKKRKCLCPHASFPTLFSP